MFVTGLAEKRSLDAGSSDPPSKRLRADTSDGSRNGSPQTKASGQKPKNRYSEYHCTYDGCERVFNRPSRLEEHIRSHTGERPFVCTEPDCDKTFQRDYHLSRHLREAHTDERNFPCSQPGCDLAFTNRQRLKRHEETHVKKQRYMCTGYAPCQESFRKKSTLQAHINATHLALDPYICKIIDHLTGEQCGKGFPTSTSYVRHTKDVHAAPSFVCTVCLSLSPESSLSPADLSKLDICSSTPGTPASTQTSLSTTSAFRSQFQLQKHIEEAHSHLAPVKLRPPPKEHPCPDPSCGKIFNKASNRDTHFRAVHGRAKRFVCGHTDLSKSRTLQDAQGNALWTGPGCGESFTYKLTLEDHVRTAHLGLEKTRTLRARQARDSAAARKARRSSGAEANGRGVSAAAHLLGSAVDERRRILCLDDACAARFFRDFDLGVHCERVHGMEASEVAGRMLERKAQEGGEFWFGGIDPAEERRVLFGGGEFGDGEDGEEGEDDDVDGEYVMDGLEGDGDIPLDPALGGMDVDVPEMERVAEFVFGS